MHLRDREIQKLREYAKTLGIQKVEIRSHSDCYHAFIVDNPKEIHINKRLHKCKLEIIMSFLHELAHAEYEFLHGQTVPDICYEYFWKKDKNLIKVVPKKYRYAIMKFEIDSLKLMPLLAQALLLKIPLWKVKLNMEFDQWNYKEYYKRGEFPPRREERIKRKQLMEKYKP